MNEDVKDTKGEDIQENSADMPIPEVSATSRTAASAQPLDVDALVSKVVEKLGPTLDSKVDQRFKKTTDPRFADVRKVAQYLEASGGDPEKAAREMLVDQMLEREASPAGPAGTVSDSDLNAEIKAETTLLLDSAGIAYNDPRYVNLVDEYKDKISSPTVWKRVLETATETWKRQEAANPAAVVVESGQSPASADLQSQYNEDLAALPQGEVRSIAKLKAEYRKKGLEVW